ncbi:DIL and Ankyrin domain protein [Streptomyces azureus]|uniref:DIL and Ankyrin domain protein n=1 Tax=Streptomyces azureus TaxID=146537 RepID=A0A0K8PMP4_STRAJ|nr:DIL and Ankyrin domain protein [Streptomyces azureus]
MHRATPTMMGTASEPGVRYARPVTAAADAPPNATTPAVRRADFHGSTARPPILLSGVILLRIPGIPAPSYPRLWAPPRAGTLQVVRPLITVRQ